VLKQPDLYNLHNQASVHAHSNLRLHFGWTNPMNFSSSPTSSFCRTELERALKEQAFGIQNFTITSCSAEQASASVALLEGQKHVVQLTAEGFSVVNLKPTKTHETIENLLQSVSPLYVKKRQEKLFAALSKLS